MAKLLTFNDGTTIEVMSSSTIYGVIIIFNDPIKLMNTWDLFTKENLSHGTIGELEFFDIVPLDLDLIKDDNGMIIARFESRDKTKVELAQEEINEILYGH